MDEINLKNVDNAKATVTNILFFRHVDPFEAANALERVKKDHDCSIRHLEAFAQRQIDPTHRSYINVCCSVLPY